MGVQIGQTSAAVLRLDSFSVRRRARTGEDQLSSQGRATKQDEVDIRAGFGKDTLSTAGAALETVSKNLERARQLVPSVEELSARAREAAARDAAEAAAREQRKADDAKALKAEAPPAPEPDQPTVSARPKAEPLARLFADSKTSGPAPTNTARAEEAPSAQETAPENEAQEAPAPAPAQRDGAAELLNLLA